MKKLTRKTFSRKFVAIGLSSFLGIGLVSTGFAAWVMSSNAGENVQSNVTIATLSDVSMQFQNVAIQDGESITFGADSTDTVGRLTGDDNDPENLDIVITGKISNANELGKLTVKVELPEAIQAAVAAGYIKAPECATSNGIVIYDDASGNNSNVTISENTATFTYTLSFEWGDFFGGMNPCHYYDAPEGEHVSNEEMATQMQAFHNTITSNNTQPTQSYTVTFSATAKSSL